MSRRLCHSFLRLPLDVRLRLDSRFSCRTLSAGDFLQTVRTCRLVVGVVIGVVSTSVSRLPLWVLFLGTLLYVS